MTEQKRQGEIITAEWLKNQMQRSALAESVTFPADIWEKLLKEIDDLAAEKWQPIETAPKDGKTRILVTDGKTVASASWQRVSRENQDWDGYTWSDDGEYSALCEKAIMWSLLPEIPQPPKSPSAGEGEL